MNPAYALPLHLPMRFLLPSLALLLVSLTLTSRSVTLPDREAEKPSPTIDPAHVDVPLDEVCATGCAAEPDPGKDVEAKEIERWLRTFAETGSEEALEHLLFYGNATRARLASDSGAPLLLSAGRELELRRELSRTHVFLDVRMIDERGIERLRLGAARIPIGEKQHLHAAETDRLTPPEVSGTVQRVGREHLWARL